MKKLSLLNAEGNLSRSEMKNIMAGSNFSSCGSCSGPSFPGGSGCYSGPGTGCLCMDRGSKCS
jgi:hypothetical protein